MMKRNSAGCVLAAGLCLFSLPAMSADYTWIVGGGYDLGSSQVQIEKNVLWARQALLDAPSRSGDRNISVFFSDGDDPGKDIKSWQPADVNTASLQPLAMIYGAAYANGVDFRNHHIDKVRGTTQRDYLEQALRSDFEKLNAGDRGLFIFNGHGGHNKKNTAENRMFLWGDTSLSVIDMSRLLNHVNDKATMRFVFTQCYSGGFERLMHPAAEDSNVLVSANRCGFFAESEHRQAEGCSAGINTGDYRDYSTYFFAALQGQTRQGEALPENPDRDSNSEVSLYEAHLYTLSQAHSADLPRSTSEVYLERWQPWHLRWFSASQGSGNVYAELASQLAKQLEVPGSQSAQRSVAGKLKRRLKRNDAKLEKERDTVRQRMNNLRYTIRFELEKRWPEAANSRTDKYRDFLDNHVDEAQAFILAHEDWADLLSLQQRLEAITRERLQIERDLNQFDKLDRLNKLARLRQQFEQHANATEKAEYQRLLACEQQPL